MLETALHPIISYLDDKAIIEIMLNPDGTLWVERLGKPKQAVDPVMSVGDAERAIRLIASAMGMVVDSKQPSLAATLPRWGCRVQAMLPPIVSAPAFSMRKPASRVFTLAEYVDAQIITAAQAALIRDAVLARKTIVVSGGTGSGKTTFANALLKVIAETDNRVYIVEDNRELQCDAKNKVEVYTTTTYSMRDAIIDALRMAPDRIIIGEVRDGGALDMLKAWNTGHPGGIATVHANNPQMTLNRLCQLIEENNMVAPRDFVADAIDLIVHLSRDPRHPAGRRLSGIVEVRGLGPSGEWDLNDVESFTS
ncbi:MAG: P-type conjugative transfer ATPase TrbB [Gammaproteobacteria bacterium]|nr:P-type conjugative transfer ATPase TrbB [Gammaproteobacteria bacterium]MCP4388156.1 P-type conjugative transfer ATPase TrbB [Gammaproteobacteria bacterium]MCP5093115.1 P-type conjugative transfer ATPase TrbB [Gammaproteobacteria bacterium]